MDDQVCFRFLLSDENWFNAFQWEVCAGVLEVLHRLVENYEITPEHFIGSNNNYGKDPGHMILLQMYSESNLLRMVCTCFHFNNHARSVCTQFHF